MKRAGWIAWLAGTGAVLALPASVQAAARLSPGLYLGKGKLSGGFTGHSVDVKIKKSGLFEFCLRISADGAVAPTSRWSIGPTTLSDRVPHASGSGIFDGGGALSGTAASATPRIILSGTQSMSITIGIAGLPKVTVPVSFNVANERLHITTLTRTGFRGDVAFPAEKAQGQSGFHSTERGYFTATQVARCTVPRVPKIT